MNVDNIQSSKEPDSALSIYDKNRILNKERIGFYSFLTYASKSEMIFDSFQAILFWIGALEMFSFLLIFALFLSYPSQMWRNIFFLTHSIRGAIGLLLLKYIPSTSSVIDSLDDIENQTLSSIQKNIYEEYKKLLKVSEAKIRQLMRVYWILTIFNFLMDIIIFIVLLVQWGKIEYNFRNIGTLVLICVLFVSNLSMLFWFGEISYILPAEMVSPVRKAVLFESKQLLDMIGSTIKRKFFPSRTNSMS